MRRGDGDRLPLALDREGDAERGVIERRGDLECAERAGLGDRVRERSRTRLRERERVGERARDGVRDGMLGYLLK